MKTTKIGALLACGVTLASCPSRPADAASKAEPAAAAAATTALAGEELPKQAVREARAFLGLVRDAADGKAYERMSDEFRKQHTAEQFSKDAANFRENLPLPASIGVNGEVWLNPKDGGPARASLRAGMPLGLLFSGGGGRDLSRPPMSAVTLSLVREDGKWHVASLQDVRATGARAIGKSPKFDRKDSGRVRVSSTLEGKVVKFEDGSLTLRVEAGAGGAPPAEFKLKVDDQTVAGAPPSRSTSYSRSSASEIKADHRASVEPSEDGSHADCVMMMQDPEPGAAPEGL
jgi:hypothetical protein